MANELRSNSEIYEDIGPNFRMRIPGLTAGLELDAENAGGSIPLENTLMEFVGTNQDCSGWDEGVTVAILDSRIEDHPALAKVNLTRIDLPISKKSHGHDTAMVSLLEGRVCLPKESLWQPHFSGERDHKWFRSSTLESGVSGGRDCSSSTSERTSHSYPQE